ncbi:MAG: class I SAM-dependent methyltransferase [Planctomycetales bacterium]|nr:class I SAM-dependent methyltransferase [Planctomycetales bacterium]
MTYTPTREQIEAGQAVYTRRTLALYDLVVLGVSNRWIWKCPTSQLLKHYNRNVSANHLDVGVGTGFYLDRCRFPASNPRVALMDLNPESLSFTSRRIARYQPELYRQSVCEPIQTGIARFDSVAINYLLHCLPGTMALKAAILEHLKPLMNPGAVLFGSTLLQGDVPRSWLAKRVMKAYNRQAIFSNEHDDLRTLQDALDQRLTDVQVEVVGCAALFSGRAADH